MVNRTVVVARVMVAMMRVVHMVDDVMVLVTVSVNFVGHVVVSVVVEVGFLLGLVDFVKGDCVALHDVVMHVLFVGFSDYCHRIIVVKQITGFIGFVLPDYQREVVLIK